MNFDEILQNILKHSDYPAEKREEFINTFYEYLLTRLLKEIGAVDATSVQKLVSATKNTTNQDEFNKALLEISKNPQVKQKIDSISNEVIGQLVDDVAAYATEGQKQKILSSLPASAYL